MMRRINRIVAKLMMVVACAIIMLHAIVPHHHHDSLQEMGMVFEDEFFCHCDQNICHDAHQHGSHCHDKACDSRHPFDPCKLQELLSHLVLSSKEDEIYLALSTIAVHDLFVAVLPYNKVPLQPFFNKPHTRHHHVAPLLPTEVYLVGTPLRAPPVCHHA